MWKILQPATGAAEVEVVVAVVVIVVAVAAGELDEFFVFDGDEFGCKHDDCQKQLYYYLCILVKVDDYEAMLHDLLWE